MIRKGREKQKPPQTPGIRHLWGFIYGADDGTRTRGLLITNELLYQLSYISDSNSIANIAEKVKQFGAKYSAPNPLQYFV